MNKDRDLDVNFKFIHLINNGLDYITPGIDSNVKLVKTKFAELTGNIQSGMDICEQLHGELPKCQMQKALLSIKRQLTAASSIASATQAAVGTADLTSLKVLPVPVIPSPQKTAPTRKRGIPTATVSSAAEMDEGESLSKRQKQSKSRVGTKDQGPDPEDFRQDTTLPKCMCYCGQSFATKTELDQHVPIVHEVKGWLCGNPDCTKLYDDKNKLFKHVRVKHLDLLNYKCNQCPKPYEEWNGMRAHLDEVHNIPAPDLRCQKCNKLFYQKNKLVAHEANCGTRVKRFKCEEIDCGYRCRSQRSLTHHMENEHAPDGVNVLRYPCTYPDCTSFYRWKEGLEKHIKEQHMGLK